MEKGQCNHSNTKADTFYVLWLLYYYAYPELKPWILKWFRNGDKLLKTKWGFAGILCNLIAPQTCDGDYEPSDSDMMPTRKIVEQGFNQFKKHLPQFDPKYLPENNFKNIFYYPVVLFNHDELRTLEEKLDSSRIQNVEFTIKK